MSYIGANCDLSTPLSFASSAIVGAIAPVLSVNRAQRDRPGTAQLDAKRLANSRRCSVGKKPPIPTRVCESFPADLPSLRVDSKLLSTHVQLGIRRWACVQNDPNRFGDQDDGWPAGALPRRTSGQSGSSGLAGIRHRRNSSVSAPTCGVGLSRSCEYSWANAEGRKLVTVIARNDRLVARHGPPWPSSGG
jgi:hypothetical protein